jgi:hypothetical protein
MSSCLNELCCLGRVAHGRNAEHRACDARTTLEPPYFRVNKLAEIYSLVNLNPGHADERDHQEGDGGGEDAGQDGDASPRTRQTLSGWVVTGPSAQARQPGPPRPPVLRVPCPERAGERIPVVRPSARRRRQARDAAVGATVPDTGQPAAPGHPVRPWPPSCHLCPPGSHRPAVPAKDVLPGQGRYLPRIYLRCTFDVLAAGYISSARASQAQAVAVAPSGLADSRGADR